MQSDIRSSSNGSASSNLLSADCSGLRRSSRLTPSKKENSLTPLSTRKSTSKIERTPLKPPPWKKAEEQGELPLRRSIRGIATPNSGISEKSPSGTDSRNKSGKRKRIMSEEESPMEVSDADGNRKLESNAARKKRMNAQSYRALFKTSDTCNGKRYSDGCPSSSQSERRCLGESEDANNENEDFVRDPGEDNTERISKRQRVSDPSPMYFCSDGNPVEEEAEQANRPIEAQTDNNKNACIVCKLSGKLLFCKGTGCGTRCHPSCVDPTLKDLHPGDWFCPSCVRKKIEGGVYTVSDGVESIWDAKEVDAQNGEDSGKLKQYFVKYKGLAHVHNCWVTESQLLEGNPDLVAKFIQQEEAVRWRPEWTIPDRLLQKRSITIPKSDEGVSQEGGGDINSHEWLVKWRGLDYSHVTWELENASFLQSSHALDLIKEYKIRHYKSKSEALGEDEMQAKKKGSSTKFSKLQTAVDSRFNVNNLCDYWRRRHNLVLIDEEDQIARTVHLISTVLPDVSRPFLIITPSGLFSKWEAEFLQSAASINVVFYGGNKEAREIIRTVEFYREDNCIMFQVLLSSHDITAEDMDMLKCIKWEAIVIDQCHNSHVLANSSFVKQLDTDWTLLLMSEQINENVTDYCNVLSLLNLDEISHDRCSTNELKEKLSPFIIRQCKSNMSRFVEYWVPAKVSDVQLEQYCSSLLSDSAVLCSKSDPLDNLPKTLLCARKCCDHPYVVNPMLQSSLIQGHAEELVDIGIRASGKLQLLDAILSEVKTQALRVLVLFQAVGGAGRDPLGDILDDFVRERYGTDSYERVDACEISSRKQTALNKFNSDNTRFVFLLDTRACSPIIKLQSVDCVLIFNSDWNPLADLKALQKIKIDTKKEKMNVFRLYTPCTIDEKVLILSKNGVVLDSTMHAVSWNTSHTLLMWGASYLLKKLDEFHNSDASGTNGSILPTELIFKTVLQEFSSLLQKHDGHTECKFISKATMKGGVYSRDISLAGEQIIDLENEELPSLFWEKLLKGRRPRWRYLPVLSSQRSRKRIQHSEGMSVINVQNDESSRKPKVVGNADTGSCGPKVGAEFGKQSSSGASVSAAKLSSRSANDPLAVSAGKQRLLEEQKSLHQDLRPVMTKLYEILGLQEEVKEMADRFLKYVINNHRVTKEPESILQAFEISVCWVAASLLGQKIDLKDSLILAREHLKFSCDDDEADYILSKTKSLSGFFIHRSVDLKGLRSPRDPNSGAKRLTREAVSRDGLESDLFNQQKVQTSSASKGGSTEKDASRNNYEDRAELLEKLIQRQSKEVHELKKSWEEKKAELEKNYQLDSHVIQSIYPTPAVRIEKLTKLDKDYAKTCQQLDSEMATILKDLEFRHECEKHSEGANRADSLLVKVNPMELDKRPSAEAGVTRETLQVVEDNETQVASDDPGNLRVGQISVGNPSSTPGVQLVDDNEMLVDSDDPGNLQVDQIYVGDPSSTSGVQGSLPGIMEGNSLMQVVESCELPAVPVDRAFVSDNDDDSNCPPEVHKSNEVIPATDTTLDNVEVVHPTADCHQMSTSPSGRPFQQSTENHITDALTNLHLNENAFCSQVAAPGQCDGAITVGDRPASGQPLKPSSITQSHASPSEASLMVVDQTHASAGNGDMVNNQHVNAETMSSRLDFVIQSEDPEGTGEEPGVSIDEAAVPSSDAPDVAQIVPSVAPDECCHPSLSSSSEPQRQLAEANPLESGVSYNEAVQAVRTSIAPDERSLPSFRSSSEILHLPAQGNPLEAPTQLISDPSRNTTILDLSRLGPHYPTSRSLPAVSEVRGLTPPVSLPLPPQSAVRPDPLQIVLEKIQKQMDQSEMKYMETKSRLDAERDKEIEEVLAQIQRKYELKAQEAEASYLQQKEEYVGMQAIVNMNKKLAEEFRCKCIDFRAAPAAPSIMHQRHQMQQQRSHPTYTSRRVPQPLSGSAHPDRPPITTRVADHLQAHPIPAADIHSRQHMRPPQVISAPFGQQHRSTPATSHQRFVSATPVPVPPSMPVQPLNNPNSIRPSIITLPPLPEIARHFDSWNLSGFDTLDSQQQPVSGVARRSDNAQPERQQQQQPHQSVAASQPDAAISDVAIPGVVCLSDDE